MVTVVACDEGDGDPGEAADGADDRAGDDGGADTSACVDWCLHRGDCRDEAVQVSDCEQICEPTYEATPARCHGEATAIFVCGTGLDCAEVDFDVTDDMGPCGEQVASYQACLSR